ncbi:MAG: GNAT family N-acetyltransferase [Actinomycetota bacterium]|nr:GNAT family N-acetyltransferase [Actinomycetota bacterium]
MQNTDWRIREAGVEDLDEVARLTARAYEEFGSVSSPKFAQAFLADAQKVHSQIDQSTLLVAEREGRLVGAVTLYLDGSAYAPGWPRESPAVRLLAVDPNERGKGIGKALVAECLERARKQGAKARRSPDRSFHGDGAENL